MTIAIPSTGRYTLANANVPAAVMGEPNSGALRLVDIDIADGMIASIAPARGGPADAARIELDRGLVLPAFVDMHTHLDKGHIWPRKQNPDGTWLGALMAVGEDRQSNWAASDVERRMDFALRCAWAHGSAAIRTHIDSAPPQHEISWDILESMQARWAGRIELQAVALIGPDDILNADNLRAVATRTKAAKGLLGGSTGVHPDNPAIMRALLEMAGSLDLDVDLHIDETGDPAADALQCLADAVIETGFAGKVTAGHCCAIAIQPEPTAMATIERVARASIAVVSLPICNMYLQDRRNIEGVRTPRWRGVTLLNELKAAGVSVAMASDNTRDPFYAYGDLDGFEVLREGARILHFDHPQSEAFGWVRSVSADPATIGGFGYSGTISAGGPAELVLFRARNWTELMARPQTDRTILRRGAPIDAALPDYRELDDLMG